MPSQKPDAIPKVLALQLRHVSAPKEPMQTQPAPFADGVSLPQLNTSWYNGL